MKIDKTKNNLADFDMYDESGRRVVQVLKVCGVFSIVYQPNLSGKGLFNKNGIAVVHSNRLHPVFTPNGLVK